MTPWTNRVAPGGVSLLQGAPGVGKGLLCCAVAAAVSRGRALPGELPSQEPGDVLLIADEAPAVVRGRMAAAGADLDRVALLRPPLPCTADL